jgi:hypothetical protein
MPGSLFPRQALVLDFPCYKHLDTSQIQLDVQPTYVRVTVKEKVFQLSLPEEVNPVCRTRAPAPPTLSVGFPTAIPTPWLRARASLQDKGTALRSQLTGHLVVTMPKAKPVIRVTAATVRGQPSAQAPAPSTDDAGRQYLEVGFEARPSSARLCARGSAHGWCPSALPCLHPSCARSQTCCGMLCSAG